jgi:hypothetical protein
MAISIKDASFILHTTHLKIALVRAHSIILVDFLHIAKLKNKRPVLYYSGHGEQTQGAWCFKKSQLAPVQIFDELKDFDFGDCMVITDCITGIA